MVRSRKAVEAALKAEGLSGYVQWLETSHNNLRLGWVEVPSRLRARLGLAPRLVLVRSAPRELTGKSAKLWAYDFGLADDRDFWEPAEPAKSSAGARPDARRPKPKRSLAGW